MVQKYFWSIEIATKNVFKKDLLFFWKAQKFDKKSFSVFEELNIR